jgi:hypothetical protein
MVTDESSVAFARVRASIAHRNLIGARVEHRSGGAVLVHELCFAPTLERRLNEGPLPEREAVALVRDLAAATEALRARGLAPRQLSPESIRIHPVRGAILVDDGVPQSIVPRTAIATLGYYDYLSPEELAGDAASARSLVFSLGAILRDSLAEDAPRSVRRVVDRATAPLPGSRYVDPAEFASAVVAAVRGVNTIPSGGRRRPTSLSSSSRSLNGAATPQPKRPRRAVGSAAKHAATAAGRAAQQAATTAWRAAQQAATATWRAAQDAATGGWRATQQAATATWRGTRSAGQRGATVAARATRSAGQRGASAARRADAALRRWLHRAIVAAALAAEVLLLRLAQVLRTVRSLRLPRRFPTWVTRPEREWLRPVPPRAVALGVIAGLVTLGAALALTDAFAVTGRGADPPKTVRSGALSLELPPGWTRTPPGQTGALDLVSTVGAAPGGYPRPVLVAFIARNPDAVRDLVRRAGRDRTEVNLGPVRAWRWRRVALGRGGVGTLYVGYTSRGPLVALCRADGPAGSEASRCPAALRTLKLTGARPVSLGSVVLLGALDSALATLREERRSRRQALRRRRAGRCGAERHPRKQGACGHARKRRER